jgi:hypothetical protein
VQTAGAAELPQVEGYRAVYVLDGMEAPLIKLGTFTKQMGEILLAYADERKAAPDYEEPPEEEQSDASLFAGTQPTSPRFFIELTIPKMTFEQWADLMEQLAAIDGLPEPEVTPCVWLAPYVNDAFEFHWIEVGGVRFHYQHDSPREDVAAAVNGWLASNGRDATLNPAALYLRDAIYALELNEQDSAERYIYTVVFNYQGGTAEALEAALATGAEWQESLLGELQPYAPWEYTVDILDDADPALTQLMVTLNSPYRLCRQVSMLREQLAAVAGVSKVRQSKHVLLVTLDKIYPELEALGGGELVMSLYGSTITGEYDGWTVYLNPALDEAGQEALLQRWLETGLGLTVQQVDLTLKDGRAEDIRVS